MAHSRAQLQPTALCDHEARLRPVGFVSESSRPAASVAATMSQSTFAASSSTPPRVRSSTGTAATPTPCSGVASSPPVLPSGQLSAFAISMPPPRAAAAFPPRPQHPPPAQCTSPTRVINHRASIPSHHRTTHNPRTPARRTASASDAGSTGSDTSAKTRWATPPAATGARVAGRVLQVEDAPLELPSIYDARTMPIRFVVSHVVVSSGLLNLILEGRRDGSDAPVRMPLPLPLPTLLRTRLTPTARTPEEKEGEPEDGAGGARDGGTEDGTGPAADVALRSRGGASGGVGVRTSTSSGGVTGFAASGSNGSSSSSSSPSEAFQVPQGLVEPSPPPPQRQQQRQRRPADGQAVPTAGGSGAGAPRPETAPPSRRAVRGEGGSRAPFGTLRTASETRASSSSAVAGAPAVAATALPRGPPAGGAGQGGLRSSAPSAPPAAVAGGGGGSSGAAAPPPLAGRVAAVTRGGGNSTGGEGVGDSSAGGGGAVPLLPRPVPPSVARLLAGFKPTRLVRRRGTRFLSSGEEWPLLQQQQQEQQLRQRQRRQQRQLASRGRRPAEAEDEEGEDEGEVELPSFLRLLRSTATAVSRRSAETPLPGGEEGEVRLRAPPAADAGAATHGSLAAAARRRRAASFFSFSPTLMVSRRGTVRPSQAAAEAWRKWDGVGVEQEQRRERREQGEQLKGGSVTRVGGGSPPSGGAGGGGLGWAPQRGTGGAVPAALLEVLRAASPGDAAAGGLGVVGTMDEPGTPQMAAAGTAAALPAARLGAAPAAPTLAGSSTRAAAAAVKAPTGGAAVAASEVETAAAALRGRTDATAAPPFAPRSVAAAVSLTAEPAAPAASRGGTATAAAAAGRSASGLLSVRQQAAAATAAATATASKTDGGSLSALETNILTAVSLDQLYGILDEHLDALRPRALALACRVLIGLTQRGLAATAPAATPPPLRGGAASASGAAPWCSAVTGAVHCYSSTLEASARNSVFKQFGYQRQQQQFDNHLGGVGVGGGVGPTAGGRRSRHGAAAAAPSPPLSAGQRRSQQQRIGSEEKDEAEAERKELLLSEARRRVGRLARRAAALVGLGADDDAAVTAQSGAFAGEGRSAVEAVEAALAVVWAYGHLAEPEDQMDLDLVSDLGISDLDVILDPMMGPQQQQQPQQEASALGQEAEAPGGGGSGGGEGQVAFRGVMVRLWRAVLGARGQPLPRQADRAAHAAPLAPHPLTLQPHFAFGAGAAMRLAAPSPLRAPQWTMRALWAAERGAPSLLPGVLLALAWQQPESPPPNSLNQPRQQQQQPPQQQQQQEKDQEQQALVPACGGTCDWPGLRQLQPAQLVSVLWACGRYADWLVERSSRTRKKRDREAGLGPQQRRRRAFAAELAGRGQVEGDARAAAAAARVVASVAAAALRLLVEQRPTQQPTQQSPRSPHYQQLQHPSAPVQGRQQSSQSPPPVQPWQQSPPCSPLSALRSTPPQQQQQQQGLQAPAAASAGTAAAAAAAPVPPAAPGAAALSRLDLTAALGGATAVLEGREAAREVLALAGALATLPTARLQDVTATLNLLAGWLPAAQRTPPTPLARAQQLSVPVPDPAGPAATLRPPRPPAAAPGGAAAAADGEPPPPQPQPPSPLAPLEVAVLRLLGGMSAEQAEEALAGPSLGSRGVRPVRGWYRAQLRLPRLLAPPPQEPPQHQQQEQEKGGRGEGRFDGSSVGDTVARTGAVGDRCCGRRGVVWLAHPLPLRLRLLYRLGPAEGAGIGPRATAAADGTTVQPGGAAAATGTDSGPLRSLELQLLHQRRLYDDEAVRRYGTSDLLELLAALGAATAAAAGRGGGGGGSALPPPRPATVRCLLNALALRWLRSGVVHRDVQTLTATLLALRWRPRAAVSVFTTAWRPFVVLQPHTVSDAAVAGMAQVLGCLTSHDFAYHPGGRAAAAAGGGLPWPKLRRFWVNLLALSTARMRDGGLRLPDGTVTQLPYGFLPPPPEAAATAAPPPPLSARSLVRLVWSSGRQGARVPQLLGLACRLLLPLLPALPPGEVGALAWGLGHPRFCIPRMNAGLLTLLRRWLATASAPAAGDARVGGRRARAFESAGGASAGGSGSGGGGSSWAMDGCTGEDGGRGTAACRVATALLQLRALHPADPELAALLGHITARLRSRQPSHQPPHPPPQRQHPLRQPFQYPNRETRHRHGAGRMHSGGGAAAAAAGYYHRGAVPPGGAAPPIPLPARGGSGPGSHLTGIDRSTGLIGGRAAAFASQQRPSSGYYSPARRGATSEAESEAGAGVGLGRDVVNPRALAALLWAMHTETGPVRGAGGGGGSGRSARRRLRVLAARGAAAATTPTAASPGSAGPLSTFPVHHLPPPSVLESHPELFRDAAVFLSGRATDLPPTALLQLLQVMAFSAPPSRLACPALLEAIGRLVEVRPRWLLRSEAAGRLVLESYRRLGWWPAGQVEEVGARLAELGAAPWSRKA